MHWNRQDGQDGFITNGVRVLWNSKDLSGTEEWTEISCRGNIYSIRSGYRHRGKELNNYNNILKDGTLISIGGITLMWKSGGQSTSVSWSRAKFEEELNRKHIQCPVRVFPKECADCWFRFSSKQFTLEATVTLHRHKVKGL